MATFNIRRFAHPDTLKSINPVRLVAFLRPHADFLSGRGVPLSGNGGGPVDYERLASVLMNLESDAPQALLESLYLIHEMATDDGMDRLLEAAKAQGLALDHDPDSSPADIAIQMFLTNRDLLGTAACQHLHLPGPLVSVFLRARRVERHVLSPG